MQGELIPNVEPVGNDTVLTPITVEVPLILFDNGLDLIWYPEAMDKAAADRMSAYTMAGCQVAAYRVTVPIVLPAAQEIARVTRELHRLICEPLRVQMRASD